MAEKEMFGFGDVDWNTGSSQFLKIASNSEVTIRVLSVPHAYGIHWIENAEGKKKKINTPKSDPKLVKRLEDAGFKLKRQYLVLVLDRTAGDPGVFKIYDMGPQVYNGIKMVQESNKKRKLKISDYDIEIRRGSPGQNPLYSAQKGDQGPLPTSLLEPFMEFQKEVDFEQMTRETPPSDVYAFMGWDTADSSFKSHTVNQDADGDDDYAFGDDE